MHSPMLLVKYQIQVTFINYDQKCRTKRLFNLRSYASFTLTQMCKCNTWSSKRISWWFTESSGVQKEGFCAITSMLDIYAEREKFIKTFPDILECNFLQFTSTFVSKNSNLEKRKRPVIVKTYPNFSSNPQNQHYGLFCKYQLLKYKPWQHAPDNAWDNFQQWNLQSMLDECFVQWSWEEQCSWLGIIIECLKSSY